MAIANSVQLYINGRQQTHNIVMPVQLGGFLDEQLDEATISLRASKNEYFSPLSCAELIINNEVYWSKRGDGFTRTETKYFIVADDKVTETPNRGVNYTGKRFYNHELYLLEATKILERVVVRSLTFTNDLGRNYTENSSLAEPVWG